MSAALNPGRPQAAGMTGQTTDGRSGAASTATQTQVMTGSPISAAGVGNGRTALASTGRAVIAAPEFLQVKEGIRTSYGAHQIWYSSWIKRMSGCGPTATSNLLWYLCASRPELCSRLFTGNGTEQKDMLRLMDSVWQYVTPGMRGVNRASMLADGGVRYGTEHGVGLEADILEIPEAASARPDQEMVYQFLAGAFQRNLPVAFLNLSNGAVRNLDNWHWVTLISVDETLQAEMYDQGCRQMINVALWLQTTTGGGAFVTIEPK